ncbi:tRNA methyltransferase 10 homolog B isoform X2 [Manacus candei]|uniref:tRNA methyltransferase 10 homolog B isoform X2 n=1 Tax=Manacus candei TaxID=415023 RepID=UPI00222699A1|nr:tRNA methyltransferase 10 homolog B isoform X2 [Manacus candei]
MAAGGGASGAAGAETDPADTDPGGEMDPPKMDPAGEMDPAVAAEALRLLQIEPSAAGPRSGDAEGPLSVSSAGPRSVPGPEPLSGARRSPLRSLACPAVPAPVPGSPRSSPWRSPLRCPAVPAPVPGGPADPCPPQRNALRKRRRWERVVAARRGKRRQERQRRRARRAPGRGDGAGAALGSGPAGPAQPPLPRGRVPAALARERLLQARAAGPRLCLDLGVAGGMTEKESGRLASQIRRLYGANRRAARPFWLCLTEFAAGTPIYEQCLRMNDGFARYLMDTTPESYLDLFPLDAIVYLTPDSENVLEDIDPDKVYVLGGLVDESIHKLTLQRAREQCLQTARLPIREYMVKAPNSRNYHSETLAINQVFDILCTYYETRSWPVALNAGVSSGKGFVLREGVEQVETAQHSTAQGNSLFCGEELHRQEAPA